MRIVSQTRNSEERPEANRHKLVQMVGMSQVDNGRNALFPCRILHKSRWWTDFIKKPLSVETTLSTLIRFTPQGSIKAGGIYIWLCIWSIAYHPVIWFCFTTRRSTLSCRNDQRKETDCGMTAWNAPAAKQRITEQLNLYALKTALNHLQGPQCKYLCLKHTTNLCDRPLA